MRDIPPSVLASWPIPNYKNPPTHGNALTVVDGILIGVNVLAVALRYYSRIMLKRWFGKDDVFIGLAMLSTIALNTTVILAVSKYGWNRHLWDIPIPWAEPALKVAMLSKIFFALAVTFTRHSLLCFYSRLVQGSGLQSFRHVVWVSQGFVFAVGLTFVVLAIWQCHPISAYWTVPPHPSFSAHCLDEGSTTLSSGIINCVADLLVTILPTPIVMRLQMPRQQRVSIWMLLSLGYIVAGAGAARSYYIWKSLIGSWDLTWWAYPMWIATTVEVNLGVLCACVPALRPLIWARGSGQGKGQASSSSYC